jgi:hypothetical protein
MMHLSNIEQNKRKWHEQKNTCLESQVMIEI